MLLKGKHAKLKEFEIPFSLLLPLGLDNLMLFCFVILVLETLINVKS